MRRWRGSRSGRWAIERLAAWAGEGSPVPRRRSSWPERSVFVIVWPRTSTSQRLSSWSVRMEWGAAIGFRARSGRCFRRGQ